MSGGQVDAFDHQRAPQRHLPGFWLQRELGVQLTRVIRTVVTCKDAFTGLRFAGARAEGALPPDLAGGELGLAAPPGPAARLGAGAAAT